MHYIYVASSEPVVIPSEIGPFRSVILIERSIDSSYRYEVARQLLDAGCLWAMSWGLDCLLWHDSIDDEYIEKCMSSSVTEDQHIMTSWHDDESIEDVFFFAKCGAALRSSGQQLVDLLILDFGRANRERELREIYERV